MTTPKARRQLKPLTRAEIARFERLRLDRRWSYRALAEDVARVCRVAMPEPTLYKTLKGRPAFPLTSHPLRRYLDEVRA